MYRVRVAICIVSNARKTFQPSHISTITRTQYIGLYSIIVISQVCFFRFLCTLYATYHAYTNFRVTIMEMVLSMLEQDKNKNEHTTHC